MAILKQNGTSAKIIRANQSGKAMKQNYNFGNAFDFKVLGVVYFDVPSMVGEDYTTKDFSILLTETYASNYGGSWTMYEQLGVNEMTFSTRLPSGAFLTRKDGVKATTSSSFFNNTIFHGVTCDSLGNLTKVAGNTPIGENKPRPSSLILTGFRIGFGSSTFHNDKVSNGSKMNSFLFFDRILTINEGVYWENNKLGNEPLSIRDLKIYIKFNLAEILDFGGGIGQAVGCRDFSGNNRHARMVNLPSGTLQEQLDYANNNLFVRW